MLQNASSYDKVRTLYALLTWVRQFRLAVIKHQLSDMHSVKMSTQEVFAVISDLTLAGRNS